MTSRRSFLASIAAALAGRAVFRPWPQCAVCGHVRAMKIFAPDRPWIPPTYLPCLRCQRRQWCLDAARAARNAQFINARYVPSMMPIVHPDGSVHYVTVRV